MFQRNNALAASARLRGLLSCAHYHLLFWYSYVSPVLMSTPLVFRRLSSYFFFRLYLASSQRSVSAH